MSWARKILEWTIAGGILIAGVAWLCLGVMVVTGIFYAFGLFVQWVFA